MPAALADRLGVKPDLPSDLRVDRADIEERACGVTRAAIGS